MLHRHTRGRQQLPLAYDHGRTDAFTYSYSKTYKPKKRRSLLFRSVLMFGGAVSVSSGRWIMGVHICAAAISPNGAAKCLPTLTPRRPNLRPPSIV